MAKKAKKENKRRKKGKIVLTETFSTAAVEYSQAPMPAQHQTRPEYRVPIYKNSAKLHGKVALITGGDSGIGRAVATFFAREGADVAIIYLKAEQLDAEETSKQIKNEGRRALLIPGDVTKPKFCQDAVEKTVSKFGKLDILVNNAAYQNSSDSIEKLSDANFDKTFKTNVYGCFYMTKAALKYLAQGGAIINTTLTTRLAGSKTSIDYSATNGAIHAFTKSLAQNLVEKGIRVNCVASGLIQTSFNVADKTAKEVAKHDADTQLKRSAQPEEIAPAYVFFASEVDSGYITGEILTILGGETNTL